MRLIPCNLGLGRLTRHALGVRLGRFHQYSPRQLCLKAVADARHSKELPSIVIVTPSFNQDRFVEATVRSVLAQDYSSLRYVVQDACSSDNTASILDSLADPRMTVRFQKDEGQADGLNLGFAHCHEEIMAYLNSDDLFLPGTLTKVGSYFLEHPDVDVIYGNRLIIDEIGQEVGRWILPGHDPELLRFIDYVPQESMFWRRRIWSKVGSKFNEKLNFVLDWDLILRFIDAGAKIHHLSDLVGVFRVHGNQKSQATYRTIGVEEMSTLRLLSGKQRPNLLQRALIHGRFLYKHRQADVSFVKALGVR